MRTKGVAKITAEDAIALGASGPTLRGSGVDIDLRRDMPYSGYENFKFKVPVAQEGDVFARYMCRVRELRESIAIVRQALDGMPEGPIKADAPKVVLPDREKMKTQMESLIYHFKIITEGFAVPEGEVYQAVESPRGEMGYYIVSDGTAKPYRVHMRSACLANLQTIAQDVRRTVDRRRGGGDWQHRHCAGGDRPVGILQFGNRVIWKFEKRPEFTKLPDYKITR